MNLTDAVDNLRSFEPYETLFVRKPWTPTSETMIVKSDSEGRVSPAVEEAGFSYFLEVEVCRDALRYFGRRRSTLEDRVRLLLYYAEYDAFPEWAG